MATAFHLAWPYGISRIMSSFAFENGDQGPPADSKGNIISPQFNHDGACVNGWICEHRWRQIYSMIKFKSVAGNSTVENWWDNGNNQIAFSRGNRAFIVFNLESGDINRTFKTGLPSGSYCEITSGSKSNSKCLGKMIKVDGKGNALINLPGGYYDGFAAIHVEEKL
jgi:alpha-amylase